MRTFQLTALAAAFTLVLGSNAWGAVTKDEYKVSKSSISAKYKADKDACKGMKDNAKDVCMEEAKGREKIAKAELESNYKPSDKNRYDVRIAKADATYAVAKEKCDDLTGNPKDVCVKEAKAKHVAAKADAKVAEKTAELSDKAREKTVDAKAAVREKTAEVKKDAAADKRDAEYAVAKEKCDALSGDAKSNCVKAAKTRFGQS